MDNLWGRDPALPLPAIWTVNIRLTFIALADDECVRRRWHLLYPVGVRKKPDYRQKGVASTGSVKNRAGDLLGDR